MEGHYHPQGLTFVLYPGQPGFTTALNPYLSLGIYTY